MIRRIALVTCSLLLAVSCSSSDDGAETESQDTPQAEEPSNADGESAEGEPASDDAVTTTSRPLPDSTMSIACLEATDFLNFVVGPEANLFAIDAGQREYPEGVEESVDGCVAALDSGEMTDAHIEEFKSLVSLDKWQWLFEHTENHKPDF